MRSILVLSIRDRHANKIFNGTKTVELRRVRPRLEQGDIVLIYVPKPVMAVAGGFAVKHVVSAEPGDLWKQVGRNSGLTKNEFHQYYSGTRVGFGIEIAKTWRLGEVLSLTTLRQWWPNFNPPQSFRYLRDREIIRAKTSSTYLLPNNILNSNGLGSQHSKQPALGVKITPQRAIKGGNRDKPSQ